MARALIGITSHLVAARWGDVVREAVLSPQSYSRAVERAGAVPVLVPPIPPGGIARLIEGLDGVLFTGGEDVDPALYGAARHERTDQPDARRDRFELALARAVVDAKLPFLAICRGLHVLNVARGGTLVQHLPDAVGHHGHAPDRARISFHDVRIEPASKLGKLLGDQARVPGSHHQAVARLGDGLEAAAWADDQTVEAAELRGNPFGIGVQWRPEEADDLRIFEAFAAAAEAA
jgi:gamma-glutamyl-gamma-aminobutyrate hydrolase PuuD